MATAPFSRDHERGSVTLWLALSAMVMALCVGLAVDLGGKVHAQERAHHLAAQAARTAGEQVSASAMRGLAPGVDANAARAAALAYLSRAGVTGTVAITGGNTVTVTVRDTYAPVFLGAIGVPPLTVTGTSAARLVRAVDGTER